MAPLARVSVTEMIEVNGRIAMSNCYATFCLRKFHDYHLIRFLSHLALLDPVIR